MSLTLTRQEEILSNYQSLLIDENEIYFLLSNENKLEESSFLNEKNVINSSETEKDNSFNISEKQIDIISFANELFKGSKPMIGIEREILSDSLLKSSKSTPTLKGRL
ncbi:MAG: hypothetical protein AABZ74_09100 [Cyanobacteriota bacterium]